MRPFKETREGEEKKKEKGGKTLCLSTAKPQNIVCNEKKEKEREKSLETSAHNTASFSFF